MTFNRRDMLKYLAVTLASCGQEIVVPGTCEPKRRYNDLEEKCSGFRRSLDFDPNEVDNDGDGYVASRDCNDFDPNINMGKVDFTNGIDDNCDDILDEFGRGKIIFSRGGSEGIVPGVYTYDFVTNEVELLVEHEYFGLGNISLSPDKSKFLITDLFNMLRIFDVSGTPLYEVEVDYNPGNFGVSDRISSGSWVDDETFAVSDMVRESAGSLDRDKIHLVDRNGRKIEQLTPDGSDDESIKDVFDGKILGFGDYPDNPDRRYSMFVYEDGERRLLNLPAFEGGTYMISRSDSNIVLSSHISGVGLFKFDMRRNGEPELIMEYHGHLNDGSFNGTYMHPDGERAFVAKLDANYQSKVHLFTCFLDGSGMNETRYERFEGVTGNFKDYLVSRNVGRMESL